jgi:quaternary ammonium compound-resistance protein SugE
LRNENRSRRINWIILIIAGLCETGFAFCLGKTKLAGGTEYWLWISGFALLYVLSAVLLAKATQTIPIGIAYPVWTGIGAVGAVLLGIFVFHEPATFWRVFFLSTLILSIIGLKAIS